jgi:ABC-type transport system involved in multi-copper enzyme maturation permease subunit
MIGLVRAELLKVRSTKLVYWLALVVVVFSVVGVAATVFGQQQNGSFPLDSPEGVRSVFGAASAGTQLALVMGIVGMAAEWRHRTATSTFLAMPRRGRVVAGKLAAHAIVGFAYGVLAVIATVVAAAICLRVKHIDYRLTADHIPTVLLGALLATAIYGVVGVGYGALVRNQIAAVVSALLWSSVVDGLLVQFLPKLGKWTPGGASGALTEVARKGVDLLPVWGGALVLTAYGVVFALVGLRTTVSRDVT